MAISVTLNPTKTISLSAQTPTVSMSITGSATARFSMPLSIRWASIVDPPSELTNIAALTTTGLITRTDSDGAISTRTLTAPAAGFTITNPAGIAGDPTFVLADDLAALESQSGTGMMARTASNTYAHRTITAPAAGITVSNGDGIAGNPTLALANDLAAYEGLATSGLVARTGDGTASTRTLTAPAAGITVSNGNGVSGNPTLALANDLSALEAMSGTGLVARTASETYAQRTLTAPAAGITVTNGDGVSGNPTLVLANDLAALEGLGSTGFAARTTTDTWAQRSLAAPAAGFTITNPAGIAGNPTFVLANDLSALEALSGTNTIYYRSAADTWTAVVIGTNLTFSGGTLAATGGVAGPGSSTDHAAVRFDGAGGATIQNSAFIIDDTGNVSSFGGNIAFPATQAASADANTLDDYEEGSWTPVLIGSTVAGTHTYTAQVGRYTKVGNMVTVWARITLSALDGAASGNARVTGLPFTAANLTNLPYPGVVGAVSLINLSAGYSMFAGQIGVNSDFIAVQQLGDTIANANVLVTDFQATSIISFQFCYRVD